MKKTIVKLLGFIIGLISQPLSGQNINFLNTSIDCSVDSTNSYPGIPATFFQKGEAFFSGKIADYCKDLGFDNISLIYTDPLTGNRTVRTVDIADDGRFSTAIEMDMPGFVTVEGGNNWISARYYAEPSTTLHVE